MALLPATHSCHADIWEELRAFEKKRKGRWRRRRRTLKLGGGDGGEGKAGSRVVAILAKDKKEGEAFVKLEEKKQREWVWGLRWKSEFHSLLPLLLPVCSVHPFFFFFFFFLTVLPFPIASTFADRLALRKSPYHRPRPQRRSTGNPSGWVIQQQQPQQQETRRGERRRSLCPACFSH